MLCRNELSVPAVWLSVREVVTGHQSMETPLYATQHTQPIRKSQGKHNTPFFNFMVADLRLWTECSIIEVSKGGCSTERLSTNSVVVKTENAHCEKHDRILYCHGLTSTAREFCRSHLVSDVDACHAA